MSQHPAYRFDDFLVDPDSWKLTCDGEEVHLEPDVAPRREQSVADGAHQRAGDAGELPGLPSRPTRDPAGTDGYGLG